MFKSRYQKEGNKKQTASYSLETALYVCHSSGLLCRVKEQMREGVRRRGRACEVFLHFSPDFDPRDGTNVCLTSLSLSLPPNNRL